MGPKERRFIRVSAITLAVAYVVLVCFFAAWKASAIPQSDRWPWAEVFYGPALAAASGFLLLVGAVGVEHLVWSRKGRK